MHVLLALGVDVQIYVKLWCQALWPCFTITVVILSLI